MSTKGILKAGNKIQTNLTGASNYDLKVGGVSVSSATSSITLGPYEDDQFYELTVNSGVVSVDCYDALINGVIPSVDLSNLGSAVTAGAGAQVFVTGYGGTIAVSDGVRWRLERLYLPWASLPSASLVPVGTEASITDCGGAIAVAGVSGWVFRPIEIYNSSSTVLISGSSGSSDQVAYQFTIPAGLMGVKGVIATEFFGAFSVASANSKILKMKMGSTNLYSLTFSAAHKTFSALGRVKNITKFSQSTMDGGIFTFGGSGGNMGTSTIDTSIDAQVQFTMALGSSAETCTFQGIRATVYPSM